VTSSRIKKNKPKGRESVLEETLPDQAIRSIVTAIKLPLCCVNMKKKNNNYNKKENCVVFYTFGKYFFIDLLTFWLSYHITSL